MRPRRWQCLAAGTALILAGLGASEARAQAAADAQAQSPEELQRRVLELEQSTREQVESLRRKIQELEAARNEEKRLQEEKLVQEKEQRAEEAQVARRGGAKEFFDLQAGAQQGATSDLSPLGKDIKGNVYTGDAFKVKLGGSLRMHAQWNDTGVGLSVPRAIRPVFPPTDRRQDDETFRAFGSRTRLNMAVEGPVALGGKTSGFFEFDLTGQFTDGPVGAISNQPVLRHAFGRWTSPDLLAKGDEFVATFGQTGSFADNFADTVDFNTMLAGLGAVHRRNPRIELLERLPVTANLKLVASIGAERPVFGNEDVISGISDIGAGELSRFPALSAGTGLEAGRIGDGFGIGSSKLYARYTYGRFRERFSNVATTPCPASTIVPGIGAPCITAATNFTDRGFNNQTAWGTFTLDRIGFNPKGRALTLRLVGGGLWTQGEALHLNASFDRRTILDDDGSLKAAQSYGGFINPIFFLTETLSLRWAGGIVLARDSDRPAVTGSGGTAVPGQAPEGSLVTDFVREKNRQSEVSVWWTPGPFTFALAWNHTSTDFRRVNATTFASESQRGDNDKFELITFFSF
jgi:hypothetical protein